MVDQPKIQKAVIALLEAIGEDCTREGLSGTPDRVARLYAEMCTGYQPLEDKITVFDNPGYDQMIVKTGIKFYSMCEHHIIPFYGTCHIGYIPDKKIVGISKFARIVRYFSSRLQLQERLTTDIAEYINAKLQPRGCMVVMQAQHLCESMRGVRTDSDTITSAIKGRFPKEEFLSLIK